jgi:hypothetical protein
MIYGSGVLRSREDDGDTTAESNPSNVFEIITRVPVGRSGSEQAADDDEPSRFPLMISGLLLLRLVES